MASSDAGMSCLGGEYQVFLNFRGLDTRSVFTSFLYQGLMDAGIHVFVDDEGLRPGERIDGSLMKAIDMCRIYMPIFSRNYASSLWCFAELSQIVANTLKSEGNKEILPIFFDVEPDDVYLKTPLYRDDLLNLQKKKNLSNGQVNAWKEALMEIDATKGWELKKYKGHSKLEPTGASTFKSEGNREILPIYVDVEHDDVKLKAPLYRDVILNLEHEKKLSIEQVDAWSEALMMEDAMKGWEVKKYKGHGKLEKTVASTFELEGNKEIIPIYFDIKHDDVKLKAPLYRDVILNLEHEKKLGTEQVDAWSEALVMEGAMKGWEAKKYESHGELIKLIVEEVVKKLKTKVNDCWSICALSKL